MVGPHVDQLDGDFRHIDGCFGNRFRRADDGYNRTVVVGIAGIIQDLQSFDFAGFINDLFNLFLIPAFTEIRNKFNQFFRHNGTSISHL